ncbi:hypothetical protein C0J52_08478, partial [Blattella germanica]
YTAIDDYLSPTISLYPYASTGKSITTSVPTFAIRFHAEDEELEEIYPSADESDEEAEKQEDESSSSTGGTQSAATSTQSAITTSASATTSTIHSRDPSPMKEYLKGFGKRSTSVDAGMIDGGTPATGSDTWRLFHEIKGKIAKTVEEKFGEMKTDRRSSSSVYSGSSNIRGGRLVGGGSKDDSSFNSDSEDISESSGKGTDKEKKQDHSPKKFSVFPKSQKGKDTNSSTAVDAPSTSGIHESGSASTTSTPSKSKKLDPTSHRSKTTIKDKEHHIKHKKESSHEGFTLPTSEEVESGIEADEQMTFSTIQPNESDIPTIDYRQPNPVITPPLKPRHRRKKPSLFHKIRWWWWRLLPFISISIYYMIPLPPFISGLISGIVIVLGLTSLKYWIDRLVSPQHTASQENVLQGDKEFIIPDYSNLPILEIPAVKEYHHIDRHQGWMNEYRHDYHPDTYSINDTNSVYVRLEGSTLKISHTKLRIPKRAMFNERSHKLKFYHQRIYSLNHCQLRLLPEGLTRRRTWSKKYPICILLGGGSVLGFQDFPDAELLDKNKNKEIENVPEEFPKDGEEIDIQQDLEIKDDRTGTPDTSVMDESDDDTFCHILKPEAMEKRLYLFARTDREKEDWTSVRYIDSLKKASSLTASQKRKNELMEADLESEMGKGIDADVMWVNALVGRILFDILKNPNMTEKIRERLQRKMSTIKLPYFIEDLIVTELDLGHNMPLAHRATRPKLDERGLWIDLDITYDGTACFTLETKLNLMKIKQMGETMVTTSEKEDISQGEKSKSPMYDSELDDTAESSDDDDNPEDDGKSTSGEEKSTSTGGGGGSGSTGKKFIQVVNKIAASKYFQQATEYKYIKRAMERVSNTNLVLTVEVNGLIGTLTLNIPPPPSDRLWYGFRGNPRLWLQARPKVGERQVSVSQVTSWIEKQLIKEFQKKFVLPNMDDLVIPPMTTDLPD